MLAWPAHQPTSAASAFLWLPSTEVAIARAKKGTTSTRTAALAKILQNVLTISSTLERETMATPNNGTSLGIANCTFLQESITVKRAAHFRAAWKVFNALETLLASTKRTETSESTPTTSRWLVQSLTSQYHVKAQSPSNPFHLALHLSYNKKDR